MSRCKTCEGAAVGAPDCPDCGNADHAGGYYVTVYVSGEAIGSQEDAEAFVEQQVGDDPAPKPQATIDVVPG